MNKTLLTGGKTYIATHSGIYAGNFIRNTLPSFHAAIRQGADILEVDVSMTKDGELFIFHDGFERLLLHTDKKIKDITSKEAMEFKYTNLFGSKTDRGLDTLDAFLEEFKDTVLINLDRCWDKFPQVIEKVRSHNMVEQIIFKSPNKQEYFEILEEKGKDFMFMPVLRKPDELDQVYKYDLNVIAAELLFKTPKDELVKREQIEAFHKKGLLLWGNAIVYDEKDVIGGGYTDDISLVSDPDLGWGALMDMGFDIIQTDFPDLLYRYIKSRSDGKEKKIV